MLFIFVNKKPLLNQSSAKNQIFETVVSSMGLYCLLVVPSGIVN